ncbi:MAG: helix-turn-helix transcriptional regulator [Anaerolineaceae bacterium]|nr:helix-turn-helix transcriptional regulator [Anaerolineaceae bacterium]
MITKKTSNEQGRISGRLRKKRLQAGLSIRELARRTNLTASFLSQVENEKANLSLESLRRISEVLGVQMLYFLSDFPDSSVESMAVPESLITPDGLAEARNLLDRTYPLIKADLRPQLSLPDAGVTYELLTSRLDHKMEAFLGRISPGTGNVSNTLRTATEEFVFVLSGVLKVGIKDRIFLVEAGDSIYFEGQSLTYMANGSDTEETVWLSVVSPPAF